MPRSAAQHFPLEGGGEPGCRRAGAESGELGGKGLDHQRPPLNQNPQSPPPCHPRICSQPLSATAFFNLSWQLSHEGWKGP